jgi:hypothetical protein
MHTYDKNLEDPGFDRLLGDRPGYFRGKEIYLNEIGVLSGFSPEQKSISSKVQKI